MSCAISWVTSQTTVLVATTMGLPLFDAAEFVGETGVSGVGALGDEFGVCWEEVQPENPTVIARTAALPRGRVLIEKFFNTIGF